MWAAVSLIQSDCRILWSSISQGGINQSLRFLNGDNTEGKIVSETTTHIVNSNFRIILSSISLKRIKRYLSFLHRVNHQEKVTYGISTGGWV